MNTHPTRLPFLVFILFIGGFIQSSKVSAQGSDAYGEGIKFKLSEDGTKYLRVIQWHQFWMRNMEYNPGSAIYGDPISQKTDFALRRSRLLLMSQVNSKYLIVSHIGINNQTTSSGGGVGGLANTSTLAPNVSANGALIDGKKPQLFVHDATVERVVYGKYLSIGGGLHYWHGISRMTNASTLNFLAMDAPIFNWAEIEASDQFARFFGIFAKGKIGRFDYRIALNDPFIINNPALTNRDSISSRRGKEVASYRQAANPKKILAGYFQWQFKDIEANTLPYTVGTYIGSKKVFNIGAGFYHHPDASWYFSSDTTNARRTTKLANQTLAAVDVFYDSKLDSSGRYALTAYASANYYDYGPNFVRNIGISNPANSAVATPGKRYFNGVGNAMPTMGTGTILFYQLGLALPKMGTNGKYGRLQPYISQSYALYDKLSDPVNVLDLGFNYYMDGHHCKLTFDYRRRPVFAYDNPSDIASPIRLDGYKGEFVLQMQIYL